MITLENYIKLVFEDNKHHLDALLKIITQDHIDPNQPGLLWFLQQFVQSADFTAGFGYVWRNKYVENDSFQA